MEFRYGAQKCSAVGSATSTIIEYLFAEKLYPLNIKNLST